MQFLDTHLFGRLATQLAAWSFVLLALPGCGRAPLSGLHTHQGCPWCGPNQQVQEGQRKVGQNFYGPISRHFWVDHQGNEYDPEELGTEAWQYLEAVGETRVIADEFKAGKCSRWLRIVSTGPLVVLAIPCQHARFANPNDGGHGTRSPLELSVIPDAPMFFDEPMTWFSPDLEMGPLPVVFSTQGTAEIPLGNGKLILERSGQNCEVRRE